MGFKRRATKLNERRIEGGSEGFPERLEAIERPSEIQGYEVDNVLRCRRENVRPGSTQSSPRLFGA